LPGLARGDLISVNKCALWRPAYIPG
jgi:hypothetical protein